MGTEGVVRISVEVLPKEGIVERVIWNGGTEPIFLSGQCAGELEKEDAGAWVSRADFPYGYVVGCAMMDAAPVPIEAGSSKVDQWADLSQWAAGTYRFKLRLLDSDYELLPEKLRISDRFAISLP